MRIYKILLTVVLVVAIAVGIWYCYMAYQGRERSEKGILVQECYAEYSIY